MIKLVTALVSLALLAGCGGRFAQNGPLTNAEIAAGWELLFDGESTSGWRTFGETGVRSQWQARNGELVLTQEGGGDIITEEVFGDFDLSLEWRIAKGGNSGIFYRVTETAPAVFFTGLEYQLLDNANADEPPIEQAASLFGLYAPAQDVTRPAGEFNHTRILVHRGSVEHWLNGVRVLEYNLDSAEFAERVAESKFSVNSRFGDAMAGFAKADSGHIALQDHGDLVAFRNIKIRRLD